VLNIGALPFSECNERLPFVAIQRPAGANAILLRYSCEGRSFFWGGALRASKGGAPKKMAFDGIWATPLMGGAIRDCLIGDGLRP
jgi:hypothetical protein